MMKKHETQNNTNDLLLLGFSAVAGWVLLFASGLF